MDKISEQALVERAKTNPEAFGLLFDTYYPKILNYAVRRTGDIAVAQDITAEAFAKALNKLSTFQWRGVSIEAWLFAIATNELRMYFRQNRRYTSLEELQERDGFEPPDDNDLHQELVEAQDKLERGHVFRKAQIIIRNLPVKYQEVLALRFIEAKKVSEIALILNKPEGTVKSLLSRGLRLVRDQLTLQPSAGLGIIKSKATKRI